MTVDQHRHDEDGNVILLEQESPEDAEAKAMVRAAEAEAEASVEVARIEADAAVQLAKIERSALEDEERVELEALRVEVAAMREMNAPPPEPEAAPIVIEDAEPEPDMAPPIDEGPGERQSRRKVGLGMW